jgi:hypothetical protein
MIMEMIPQGYPLDCSTEDGRRWHVIGWTEGYRTGSVEQVLVPVVVSMDAPSLPSTITAHVEYRRPTDRARA